MAQTKKKIRKVSCLQGFHQTQIIKEIVSYCDIRSTLFQLRLVCRSWRDAINSLRFDADVSMVGCGTYFDVWEKAPQGFLQRFKELRIPLNVEKQLSRDKMEAFFIKALCHHNLTEIEIYRDVNFGALDLDVQKFNNFLERLFRPSIKSLRCLHLTHLHLPVEFPNLNQLWVSVDKSDTVRNIQELLGVIDITRNIELLIFGLELNPKISRFIADAYAHCCFSGSCQFVEMSFRFLSLEQYELPALLQYPHRHRVEYLQIEFTGLIEFDWGGLVDGLDDFFELKAITLMKKVVWRMEEQAQMELAKAILELQETINSGGHHVNVISGDEFSRIRTQYTWNGLKIQTF